MIIAFNHILFEDPQMSTGGEIAHFGFHIANFDQIMDRCKELNVEVLYRDLLNLKNQDLFTSKILVYMILNSVKYSAAD